MRAFPPSGVRLGRARETNNRHPCLGEHWRQQPSRAPFIRTLSFSAENRYLQNKGVYMSTENRWLLTRDFRLIWWSQVLSQVADGVSRLALLWFVYSVTGSALQTSIVGLLQTLSPIVLGPFIGVTVDRLPKKAILIVTDVARGILIGLIPCVLSIEVFTVDMLYVLVFLYGIATAMFVPTLSSSVPFLVDRSRFVAANAMLQSTTSIGIIIGPVLSGLGIAFSGSQDVLCANALIYFASAVCLVPIRLPWSRCPIRRAEPSPRPFKI